MQFVGLTESRTGGRAMRPSCSSCNRPLRVCLCAQLPPQPIQTATKVIILQHPHETRQKLATVPVVARCLSNVDVIVGRRLQHGTSRLLDALSRPSLPSFSSPSSSPSLNPAEEDAAPPIDDCGWQCRSCGRRKSVLLLFPTPFATELSAWMSQCVENDAENRQSDGCLGRKAGGKLVGRSDGEKEEVIGEHSVQLGSRFKGVCSSNGESGHIVLLIVDGTWKHAREMVKASMPFLSEFVEQVCFPHDITREGWGLGDSSSIIRKEPFAGCVSTMEAIARALGILEPDGIVTEQTLLAVLRRMVYLQALHFAPLKPRPRLRKERPVCHTSQPA